jgi:RNA polymerase sigma-70 factor (ECF subfamily)
MGYGRSKDLTTFASVPGYPLLMATEATQILQAISAGDQADVGKLMELMYDDLRALARVQLGGDTPNHTLDPTAVVHEAFMKLVGRQDVDWRGRSHFFAVSAKAMRHILVDYARQQAAQKRGGQRQRIPLSDDIVLSAERDEDVLALDDALEVLAEIDEQRSRIVELRFFGGMTIREVSEVLGIAERTVDKQWAATRLWLRKYLAENPPK